MDEYIDWTKWEGYYPANIKVRYNIQANTKGMAKIKLKKTRDLLLGFTISREVTGGMKLFLNNEHDKDIGKRKILFQISGSIKPNSQILLPSELPFHCYPLYDIYLEFENIFGQIEIDTLERFLNFEEAKKLFKEIREDI